MIYSNEYCYPTLASMFGRGSVPVTLDALQWLTSLESDGITLYDELDLVNPQPQLRDVNCLESTGAQTISNANIANGAVVVNAGTAVGTATAGVITFTAGTISQISLDGVLTYVCEEGIEFPLDVTGLGNHITSMTCTWGTSDSILSRNALYGFTPVPINTYGPEKMVNGDFATGDLTGYRDDDGGRVTVVANEAVMTSTGYPDTTNLIQDNVMLPLTTYLIEYDCDNQTSLSCNLQGNATCIDNVPDSWQFAVNGGVSTRVSGIVNTGASAGGCFWVYTSDFASSGQKCYIDNINISEVTVVTKYSPALEEKTKSVGSFDGVVGGDKVTPQTDFLFTGDFTARLVFKLDFSNALGQYRLIADTSLRGLIYNGGFITFYDGGFSALTTQLVTNTKYTVTVRRVGTTLYMAMDDDPETEFVSTTGAPTSALCSVGGESSTADKQLKIYEASAQDSLTGFEYDLTEYEGKATTIITDNSVNGNEGDVATGAGGLDYFWGARIADATGIIVDAGNYLPVTNPGGLEDNASETTEIQTAKDTSPLNIIRDPGFVEGISNWTTTLISGSGTFTWDGSNGLLMSGGTGTDMQIEYELFPPEVGKAYYIEIDVVSTGGTQANTIYLGGTLVAGTGSDPFVDFPSAGAPYTLAFTTPVITGTDPLIINIDGFGPSIKLDNISATPTTGYQVPQIAVNGEFVADTNWSKYFSMSIPGDGTCVWNPSPLGTGLVQMWQDTLPFVVGTDYELSIDLASITGGVTVRAGGVDTPTITASGVHTYTVTAVDTGQLAVICAVDNTACVINSVSAIKNEVGYGIFGAVPNFYTDGTTQWYKKTFAQKIAQYNLNGYLNLWIKLDANGLVDKTKQYAMSKIFTQKEAAQNLAYFSTGGLYSLDGSGLPQIDANGYIIYGAPGFDSGFDSGFGF